MIPLLLAMLVAVGDVTPAPPHMIPIHKYGPYRAVMLYVGYQSGIALIDTGAAGITLPDDIMRDLVHHGQATKLPDRHSEDFNGKAFLLHAYLVPAVAVGDCLVPGPFIIEGDKDLPLLGADVMAKLEPWTISEDGLQITCPT